MKNILFVHSSSELYGSDRSLLNIVKTINKDKYKVFVILPYDGPLVNEMKKIDGITVDIFEVAVLRRKNMSVKGGLEYCKQYNQSISYLKKYIRHNQIDLVDTNTAVVFPGAIAAKKCGKKSVWHIREIIKSNLENKVISKIMNKYADIIIANSKATADALLVNKDKVRVVYNAVEGKKQTGKEAENHSENNLNEQLIVGMAGRINRWKGQKLFVDAAKIVNQAIPEAQFHIAGAAYTGEEYLEQDLRDYINSNELSTCVHLLGQVNDMESFYDSLSIFVLPSIQPEPFGLVVIEAMSYGIPVIATNHGGPTEIIEDGKDGYLVDYADANEMAERIITLLSNEVLRIEMGKKGEKKKQERFTVDVMVHSIEEIFGELIN